MRNAIFLLTSIGIIGACGRPTTETETPYVKAEEQLRYRAELQLNDSSSLPFIFYRSENTLFIENSSDDIVLKRNERDDDTLEWQFPVFNSILRMSCGNDECNGYFWDRDKGEDYRIPLTAKTSNAPRFTRSEKACCSIKDNWEVVLRYNGERPRHALGEFIENDSGYTGSIITPTGDYRFLQGIINGHTLELATFDGKFAYYFTAELKDQELVGHYYAGLSEAIPWLARRNDTFALPDASGLTYLQPGYDRFDFTLTKRNGDTVRPDIGNVHLIQILGSWCPNCTDEARVLEKWYQTYKNDGLTVTGIAFEMREDSAAGWRAIAKMKDDLELSYPIVYGGKADPETTSKVLPMLNKVMAYPTLIVLDRRGEVQTIKTGFKGPGTSYFDNYIHEMEGLLKELLYE